MLNKHIQAPYIDTIFGLATPALILSVVYLFTLATLLVLAKMKGMLKLRIVKIRDLMKGEKNEIMISMMGYIVYIFSCINLPEFLGEKNIIIEFSGFFLKFETLVYLMLFAFLCSAFFNNTNRETHIRAANRIFHYLIWISLGAGILYGQLDYRYCKNMVVIVCAWIINVLFLVIEIKSVQIDDDYPAKFDLIPYGAVDSVDDLFPLHKKQAEDIVSIIASSSSDPFSICLSGEWGTGKTSVIHGVVEFLKENQEKPYDIIYINALELDDKKTVLMYLMTQIREKLKSRGVYVGINSEYKEFVSSFTGTMTSSTIGTFLQKKLASDDDYRAQKMKLEEVLERTYKNGKLIVIVDDIERCDRKTAREYLFLIKEVATMRCCASVFITDYDMLNEVVSVENVSKSSNDFLNKFFNYKIDLRDEVPKDILAFYDSFFDDRDPAFWSIYRIVCKSPGTWYNEAVTGLSAKLNELEIESSRYHGKIEDRKTFENRVQEQKECLSLFVRLMQKPRNVAKFYNVFRNHVLCCGENLNLSSNKDEVSKYISSRNIGQVLYLISFAEVFLPAEYDRLKKQGPMYIDPLLYGVQTISNVNKRLLVELAQGLIFGGYYEFGRLDGYVKADTKKFIKCYLSGETDLYQLINPFTSQEDEWLNAISEDNDQLIRKYWEEMVLMIFQKVPNEEAGITHSWRNEKFRFLLEFAEEQVKTGVWTSDKLFSLFNSDLHTDRSWASGTGLMKTFWTHIEKSKVYVRPSKESVDDFRIFLPRYTYARSGSIYKLLHYLIPLKNDAVRSDDLQEYLLNSNNSLGQNLSNFLKKIETAVPDFSLSSEGWYRNLKELAEKINDHLVRCGVSEYSDTREDIVHMLDTADEFMCLEKIEAWIEGKGNVSSQVTTPENFIDNLDALIDYFEKGFIEPSSDMEIQREFEKKFTNFFMMLRQAEGLTLSKEQKNRLHQLVEKFVEEFAVSSLPYRRTILNIPEKRL